MTARPSGALSPLPPRPLSGAGAPPAGRTAAPRPRRDLPVLAVDGTAGLLAVLALGAPQRHPLILAVLTVGVGGWHARAALRRRTVTAPDALDELPALCGRVMVAWALLGAVLGALSPAFALSPRALALGCAAQVLTSCAGRGIVYARRRGRLTRRPHATLVVGPAGPARLVAAALLRHPGCGVRPVGVVTDPDIPADPAPAADPPVPPGPVLPTLTTTDEVRRALVQNGVREVLVVGADTCRVQAPLLRTLGKLGCGLWRIDPDTAGFRPANGFPGAGAPRLAGFAYTALLAPRTRRTHPGKRALDVVVSGVLLLLGAPVLLLCATVIRIVDGPGVVFRQERVGKGGRRFTLLKFRTLRPADPQEAATLWSVADDSRVNAFCRFLRRTSLDELPQLWNVFRGDMSLVGPRPERPYFVAQFSRTYDGYRSRHRMETGITGLAQVQGLRGDTSIEDRARFDNAYIDTWSLWQDIRILLRTAALLVRPTGS
ncbi:exopolysaccharide biosynthesis polyprenyl glycosylphosphotransferase [Streptomyces uncialis]|uniref:exopolysaccharide biosynthesis polyprenyl glycosylphosphotransferase n=1 Tax=Streptomyces uncialis TaxID=1048205 RepID=UPI00386E0AED